MRIRSSTATGKSDGSSWSNAFRNIQQAIDDGCAKFPSQNKRHVVLVKHGTYTNEDVFNRRAPVVRLCEFVNLIGGYTGNELGADQSDKNLFSVLDGKGLSAHVVVGASNSSIQNMKIINGRTIEEMEDNEEGLGAGVFVNQFHDFGMRNVIFENNGAAECSNIYMNGAFSRVFDVRVEREPEGYKGKSACFFGGSHEIDGNTQIAMLNKNGMLKEPISPIFSPFFSAKRLAKWLPGKYIHSVMNLIQISFGHDNQTLTIHALEEDSRRLCSFNSTYDVVEQKHEAENLKIFNLLARDNPDCVAPNNELLQIRYSTKNKELRFCLPTTPHSSTVPTYSCVYGTELLNY